MSSVWGLSSVLGPVLGGLLLNYSWQLLFIINLPIAAGVLIGSIYILPKSVKNRNIIFDWYGIIILSIMVVSLAYGLNQIDTNHFLNSISSLVVWPFLVLSLLLLPIFWKVEKLASDPLIQVDLFKKREVKLISSISIGTGLIQASTVFVPAFVIVALSFSTANASLMLMPIVATMAVGAPIVGKLLDKFGSRNIMVTGAITMMIGLFIMGMFSDLFIYSY